LARLVNIPSNPVPRNAVCDVVTADDGLELRVARFPINRSPVRGTVVVLHGRNEFIEKYFETVGDLRRRGFSVVAFDARGQGGSGRLLANKRKGHVRDFADYVNDFEAVMQEVVLPDCPPPYYVLAHSTGAMVALLSAERLRTQIERMVLTSPLVALPYGAPRWVARLSGVLMHLGLGEIFLPGSATMSMQVRPFTANEVTSDPDRYARALAVLEADPSLGLGAPTIGWLNAAMRASVRMAEPDFERAVPVPVLMMLAGSDTVVDNRAAEDLARRLKTTAYLRIPGARHEILMERNEFRDQFWVAFDAFIRGRN
jgi:lysophospholipase